MSTIHSQSLRHFVKLGVPGFMVVQKYLLTSLNGRLSRDRAWTEEKNEEISTLKKKFQNQIAKFWGQNWKLGQILGFKVCFWLIFVICF